MAKTEEEVVGGRRRDVSGLPEYFWVVSELFLGGGYAVVVG